MLQLEPLHVIAALTLCHFQESEIAELEEKIVGLVTERNAQDEVIKKINEEYEEILQRSRVCEGKVEQVAGKMEELKVCVCHSLVLCQLAITYYCTVHLLLWYDHVSSIILGVIKSLQTVNAPYHWYH